MLSFLKKWFPLRLFGKKSADDGTLELPIEHKKEKKPVRKAPDADIHKLMIKATRIRKQEGYPTAIKFLKQLTEDYLFTGNTALVTCVNKLIPYMKRDPSWNYQKIRSYLEDIIARAPRHDPLFENLHLTMADLIRSKDVDEAIVYMKNQISIPKPGRDDFEMFIMLSELYIDKKDSIQSGEYLEKARLLLNPKADRYTYIRKLRKWYHTAALLALLSPSSQGWSHYLENRFIEFSLDMARVLDPLQIELFHERKDLYYKKERGFEDSDPFRNAIQALGLEEKKGEMLKEVYGFAFEELPRIMKLTDAQLHYKPGDPESLGELQEKKRYSSLPFTELPQVEDYIRKLVRKYILN
jgi:hypothetical protein